MAENNTERSFRSINSIRAHELEKTCQCGSVNFTTREVGPHLGLYCRDCDRWQTWIAQQKPIETMPLGMFKGSPISKLPIGYLDWLLTSDVKLSKSLRAELANEFERRGGV